ncbi:MAG: hypothetical protein R3E12_07380 [Candidatus Eisenbacteria bacterium]
MGRQRSLTRSDLELLHEALSYMRRRVFDQAESVRIKGVLDRIEEMLLDPTTEPRFLRISPPEQEAMERQVESFCVELTHRGAPEAGRQQASRLRRLIGAGAGSSRLGWFRRLFGR